MNNKVALVITSISQPNKAMRELAHGCRDQGYEFIVIGDRASPNDFHLDGCKYYSLDAQRRCGLRYAEVCPERHYARKNIGYLLAIMAGANLIIETDDDNFPYASFWSTRNRMKEVAYLRDQGWTNVYQYSTDELIWPRGFPLDKIRAKRPIFESLEQAWIDCPIQQGLANGDCDVDAVYRLVCPRSISFRQDRNVALKHGTWCPFNSQNTSWWTDAFPALYLPATCSFRMTDIWRSFVAERISWEFDWGVLFHEATVWHERNDHNLMCNFKDEIPGYLQNTEIARALETLELKSDLDQIFQNLRLCYQRLVDIHAVEPLELDLLDAWLFDLQHCT